MDQLAEIEWRNNASGRAPWPSWQDVSWLIAEVKQARGAALVAETFRQDTLRRADEEVKRLRSVIERERDRHAPDGDTWQLLNATLSEGEGK